MTWCWNALHSSCSPVSANLLGVSRASMAASRALCAAVVRGSVSFSATR